MKKISILIPTYNEEENIIPLCQAIKNEFKEFLDNYKYEIIFIDNYSNDKTRELIRIECSSDNNVKAIFNAKNFGQFNSPYYGLLHTTGDATIILCADFQDPINMIHKFVKEWENGYKIVIGIKTKSKENKILYFLRSCYYKLIKKFSSVEQIEHFTGFGLYDKDFVSVLKTIDDPMPYLRGMVAEVGYQYKKIEYVQQKRAHGKSKNNWYTLYDAGMLGLTSYTKGILRIATLLGFTISILSFIVAVVYLFLKLLNWNDFEAGQAPLLIGVFLIGSIQLFFIGFLGEYILNINSRLMKRPLVVEEERINFK